MPIPKYGQKFARPPKYKPAKGMVHRWVNDDPGRIEHSANNGWKPVSNAQSRYVGNGRYAKLMQRAKGYAPAPGHPVPVITNSLVLIPPKMATAASVASRVSIIEKSKLSRLVGAASVKGLAPFRLWKRGGKTYMLFDVYGDTNGDEKDVIAFAKRHCKPSQLQPLTPPKPSGSKPQSVKFKLTNRKQANADQ